jgi:hypothetical protein
VGALTLTEFAIYIDSIDGWLKVLPQLAAPRIMTGG